MIHLAISLGRDSLLLGEEFKSFVARTSLKEKVLIVGG
jgi:hypothetical protein